MSQEESPLVTKSQLEADLRTLGLRPNQLIMLHASVKAIGWIVGGPDTIIRSILDVITPDGTLMMYVSWEEWEQVLVNGVDNLPGSQRQAYLAECPPFDPATSRANRKWSILTEYLRTWPGAHRSNHPTASVAAVGSQAEWLTADHPLHYGYGRNSPFDKLCQVGGYVLLLGAPLGSLTLLHYAEHLAQIPHKRKVTNKVPLLQNGRRAWVEFEEFDTCDGIRDQPNERYFPEIATAFLATGRGTSGKVGAAQSHLFPAKELAQFAAAWIEQKWPL